MNKDLNAQWTGSRELLDDLPQKLAKIIRQKVDSPKYNETVQLLEHCHEAHSVIAPLEKSGTQKSFKDLLVSAQKHYAALDKIHSEMSAISNSLLDQSCWFANECNKEYLRKPTNKTNSIAHDRVKQNKNGVDFHLNNMSGPTKQNNECTEAIRELARGFAKLFPNKKLSVSPNSTFAQLVRFWLHEYAGVFIQKPHNQIKKAIEKDLK